MRGVAGHRRPGARPRALPRLHAGSLTPSHTHSQRSRGLPHARMPAYASALGALAHIGKPRTEQLSIRVQATHRPGAVLMPTKGKVSSVTAKDSNKRSSSGGGVPAVLRGQHTVDDSCATRDDSDEPRPCVDQSAHHALDFGVVISR